MCGRYGRYTPNPVLADLFEAANHARSPVRYNVAPTQEQPIVRVPEPGLRELVDLRWGLIPFWSRDPRETDRQYSLINARAETVAEKPSFKAAYRYRRCLIPADGFFEWQPRGGGPKQPYWIRLASGEPMAFAGLWERWQGDLDGQSTILETFTIVVGEPNEALAPIHNRMPAILPSDAWDLWLDPGIRGGAPLEGLLWTPYPADALEVVPVSRQVNNPENDGPDLIEPTG